MQNSFRDHPTDEMLERYLLNQSDEAEFEVVESHILVCSDCVGRLEQAESFITTFKAACGELSVTGARTPKVVSFMRKIGASLTPLRLSWTAGLAIVFAALIMAPAQFALRRPISPTQVTISAWRGRESVAVPAKRPLMLHLRSIDLPDGTVAVQLVDALGREVSHGSTSINQEIASVSIPPLQTPGAYFLRLYSVADTKSGQRDLLREFAFQAR
jgi:hypothetical protein